MRALINSVVYWDVLYFTKIFYFNGSRVASVFFTVLSHSGDGYLYPAIGAILFFTHPDIAEDFLFSGLTAFTVELPAYKILKNSIKRHRPCEVLTGIQKRLEPIDQFSFPSGHTAAAFLVATLLSCYLPFLIFPAFLWAICVALSRIYMGVHYPTDILAGMALGTLSALFGLLVINSVF